VNEQAALAPLEHTDLPFPFSPCRTGGLSVRFAQAVARRVRRTVCTRATLVEVARKRFASGPGSPINKTDEDGRNLLQLVRSCCICLLFPTGTIRACVSNFPDCRFRLPASNARSTVRVASRGTVASRQIKRAQPRRFKPRFHSAVADIMTTDSHRKPKRTTRAGG